MSETTVVNVRREGCDVYIGRHGIWGNPFVIGRDGTREEVIEKFRSYIVGRPDLLDLIPTLKGKRLGCFCAPKPCHGDVLKALADYINTSDDIDSLHYSDWWWDNSRNSQES